jgi:isoleucyl-tRNA synthetase
MATRPTADFIDDLSVWYLRRSRDRFKGDDIEDKKLALGTLRFVLRELAKVMAPAMPFYAEYLWGRIREESDEISVHLSKWPESGEADNELLFEMQTVRSLVTLGLEARTQANIKIRQPLQRLTVKSELRAETDSVLDLIRDEVNVKEVIFDQEQTDLVLLDTRITPELKMEGDARELMRAIQDMRKEVNLKPQDNIKLELQTSTAGEEVISGFGEMIRKTVGASEVVFSVNNGKEIKAGDNSFIISIHKL